jgi:putative oxidoreductase
MKQFPFLPAHVCLRIFRTCVAVLLIIHGVTRIGNGSVGGFGEFLNGNGFPFGFYIAWGITFFEISGGLLIILGYFVPWICMIFIIELTAGIILVHAGNGWFVVGGGTGGMEYSVLLILSFFVIAGTSTKRN